MEERSAPDRRPVEMNSAEAFTESTTTTTDLMDAISRADFDASWASTHRPRAARIGARDADDYARQVAGR